MLRPSTPIASLWVALPLLVLGSCAVPSMRSAAPSATRSPVEPRLAAADETAGPAGAEVAGGRTVPSDALQEDYSVGGLFNEHHAEFMQTRNPFTPDIEIIGKRQFDTTLTSEPGHYTFYEGRFNGRHRVPVDPDGYLIAGLTAGLRDYHFEAGFPASADGDMNLYQVSVPLGGGFFAQEDLLIWGTFEPGLWTDFSGTLTSADWQFHGTLIGEYRQSSELFWKFGLETNENFEDVPVYPVLGTAWMFSPGWRLDILLPTLIEVSWNPTAAWVVAAGLDLEGNEFATRAPVANGGQHYTQRIQELRIYLDGTYRFSDNWSAFARFGSVIAGDQEFRGTYGKADGTVQPGMFVELGGGLSF